MKGKKPRCRSFLDFTRQIKSSNLSKNNQEQLYISEYPVFNIFSDHREIKESVSHKRLRKKLWLNSAMMPIVLSLLSISLNVVYCSQMAQGQNTKHPNMYVIGAGRVKEEP